MNWTNLLRKETNGTDYTNLRGLNMISNYLGWFAHQAIDEAKLLFNHERLRDLINEFDKIWKELTNHGLCTRGLDRRT